MTDLGWGEDAPRRRFYDPAYVWVARAKMADKTLSFGPFSSVVEAVRACNAHAWRADDPNTEIKWSEDGFTGQAGQIEYTIERQRYVDVDG